MLAAQNGNHLDSSIQGNGWSVWITGLAIASSLLVPAASQAQMQALPPPPSAPNAYPPPDASMAPYPSMAQPSMNGIPGSMAPGSAYPAPVQSSPGFGGAYQVIVYGASPYLLRQIKFLEPNASIQNYQGRQVILAGSFDSPAAAQDRVLKLSDYGVGAQTVSGVAVSSPSMGTAPLSMPNALPMPSSMVAPATNGMVAPATNGMNTTLIVPTADTPPNWVPNPAGTAPVAMTPMGMPTYPLPPASVTPPTAMTPTGMPTNSWPSASVTAPTAAPTGMPMNSFPGVPVSPPIAVSQAGMPLSPPPGIPMDGSVSAPPPGVPMNSWPANTPMNAPMGSPPLGSATMTPPTAPVAGNSNSTARYEVVIPARTEEFNSIANRLISMGVSPYAIQGKQQPRGPHISVGPYAQAREAEAMTRALKMAGMNARIFFSR